MPKSLSTTQKERIEQHLANEVSVEAIHRVENVSERVIRKIRANIHTYGTHTAPRTIKQGRPTALTDVMRYGLKHFVESKPWAYLEEMQHYLFDEWDVWTTESTIFRTLKSMKISNKVLKREAAERSQLLRNQYMFQISQYTADMLVFIDESAANEHSCHRKRGWSREGLSPRIVRPVKRSERWTVTSVYCLDGILTADVHQGSMKGGRFQFWLEQNVLPRCSRFPGSRSVLVMDNAFVHHVKVRIRSSKHGLH